MNNIIYATLDASHSRLPSESCKVEKKKNNYFPVSYSRHVYFNPFLFTYLNI